MRGLEDFGAGFEGAHQARDGSFGDFAQEGFELGEGFFDGVHIRAVGWEISQLRARRLDELLDPRPLAREIGGGSGLVNENEFRRIEIELPREPFPASTLHVRALLFLGMRCFF